MKKESLNILQDINLFLVGCKHEKKINPDIPEFIQEKIRRIIRIETNGSSKFSFFDYCNPKDLRPYSQGIYFGDGWKVATDSHIIIAKKEDYSAENENKILTRKGELKQVKFPKWVNVIPVSFALEYNFNPDKLKYIQTETKVNKKVNRQTFVKCADHFYNSALFCKFLKFIEYCNKESFKVNISGALFIDTNKEKAVTLPLTKRPENVEIIEY